MSYLNPQSPGDTFIGCIVESPNTGPTLSSTTVKVKFAFNSAVLDPFSMFDDVNDRIVIPTGWPSQQYWVWGYHECGAEVAGLRTNEIRKNGGANSAYAETVIQSAGGGINTRFPYGPVRMFMQGDDYIESWVAQNSGGNEQWQKAQMTIVQIPPVP